MRIGTYCMLLSAAAACSLAVAPREANAQLRGRGRPFGGQSLNLATQHLNRWDGPVNLPSLPGLERPPIGIEPPNTLPGLRPPIWTGNWWYPWGGVNVYNFNRWDEPNVVQRRQDLNQYERDLASQVRPGDVVEVAVSSTRLKAGEDVVAQAGEGEELTISKVQGNWGYTHVIRDGRDIAGWVRLQDVTLVSRGGGNAPAGPNSNEPPTRTKVMEWNPNAVQNGSRDLGRWDKSGQPKTSGSAQPNTPHDFGGLDRWDTKR